ncbi:hypothetical protein ACFLV2_02460 [Chloroflexota bacterium]
MTTGSNWNSRTNARGAELHRHDARMRGFRLTHARIDTIDSKYAIKAFYGRLLPMSPVKMPKYRMN